jgi:DNA polymerase elongation subunit (family B)
VYRNVYYDAPNEQMKLFSWDEDGKRTVFDCSYTPYVYIETKLKGDKISLFETNLKKRTFRNQGERKQWVNSFSSERIFENIPAEQQFLIDNFESKYDSDEMTEHPMKVMFFDIETYSPNGFPTPEIAADSINVITVYDSLRDHFITWGTTPLKKQIKNCTYSYCKTEAILLDSFIKYIEQDPPDILTGWNSEFFDIPYIVNRISKVLGEDAVERLSPVRNIYSLNRQGSFGNFQTRWYISGIASLDYLDIYKKFSMDLKESYKLDFIGEIELGQKKVDYGNQQLYELADNDWQTFVEYNVQDVNLLVKLENKLRYLELLRMLSYIGMTTLEKAMGTVGIVTGSIVVQSRKLGKVIPTFKKNPESLHAKFEGAYVGEPERGFQDAIVSFDANSLYPNTMITLNLSPETKIGKIVSKDDDIITIRDVSDKIHELKTKEFLKFVNDNKITISKAKVLFTQAKKGIVPYIVDRLYKQRASLKSSLLEKKRELSNNTDTTRVIGLRDEITRLNDKQMCLKIYLNSIYGYFGNKYAPMGDPDIARSITLTGQAVIKQSNEILRKYVNNKTGSDTDPIIYNDTDSSYITIQPILDAQNIDMLVDGKVNPIIYNEVQEIEDYLNAEMIKWSKSTLNSDDSRFVFKRESICDVGMFLEKKRYVLHVLDDEGLPVNKFKYTGVEVVRSTMPAAVKPFIKKIIETMILSKNKTKTDTAFIETYETFKNLPIEDVAFVVGMKGYEKYAPNCEGFRACKGMPVHVKAAYYYNTLLSKIDISKQYENITSGEKMRYYYVEQPNQYGIGVIGYKYYIPSEFNDIFKIDTEKMFGNIVYSVIERFYKCVKWNLNKPNEQIQTDLFELLGV